MRVLFFVFSIVISGCAFKAQEGPGQLSQPVSEVVRPALSAALDWSNDPAAILDPTVKARRALVSEVGFFRMQGAVTLPVSVPGIVYLAAEVPGDAMIESAEFLRASFSYGEARFDALAEIISQDETSDHVKRVTLKISGLNSLLSNDESRSGVLELVLYGRTQRLATLQLDLRTPPSHLSIQSIGLNDWEGRGSPETQPFLKPQVSGRRLNLIRVVELENRENSVIEIQIPRRPGGSLAQWENTIQYQDAPCSYQLIQSPVWVSLADDVLALPLDAGFIPQAAQAVSNRELRDKLVIRLAPGEKKDIGLYALGEAADAWQDTGPKAPALRQLTVPSTCYSECVEWGGGPVFEFLSLLHPARMGCVQWAEKRRTENVTIGVNRGALVLNIRPEGATWSVRFGDMDFSADGESRLIPFLSTSSEVTWR